MPTYTLRKRVTQEDWDATATENPIAKRVRSAQRRVEFVLDGSLRSVTLMGGAGLGKSRTIQAACSNRSVLRVLPREYHDLRYWFEEAGGRTPLIFEECDHLFRSKSCLNLLKQATDPSGPSSVRVRVPPTRKGESATFKSIPLNQRIVFALNGDLTDHRQWPNDCIPHIQAMLSREHPIFIDGTREERWEYTVYLAVRRGLLRVADDNKISLSLNLQNAAIAFFTQNLGRLDEVSPRRLRKIAQTMLMHHQTGNRYGEEGLREDLEQFLLPDPGNLPAPPLAPGVFVMSRVQSHQQAA